MLLTKAQGSKLENIRDQIFGFVEKHCMSLAHYYEQVSGKQFKGDSLLHGGAHNQVDMFIFILEHCGSEEEAMKLVPALVSYLTGGWYSLFE